MLGESRTKTDAHGEFSIEGRTSDEGRIFVVHTDEADIVCPVPDLA